MAKLTLEERIHKVEDKIVNEELLIESSKEKIKALSAELKMLKQQKDIDYANNFIKILAENGLTSDEEKEAFIREISLKLKYKKSSDETADENAEAEHI